jgi:hypothetical protein
MSEPSTKALELYRRGWLEASERNARLEVMYSFAGRIEFPDGSEIYRNPEMMTWGYRNQGVGTGGFEHPEDAFKALVTDKGNRAYEIRHKNGK